MAVTIRVRAGDPLQAALDHAARQTGSVELRLVPESRRDPQRSRRARPDVALTIRADVNDGNFSTLSPPWVTPEYAAVMPKLAPAPGTVAPVLTCEDGTAQVRLFGLEVLPNVDWPDRDLIVFGQDAMTTLGQVPRHITLEACYVHGHPETGQHRGLLFNVAHGVVSRCYFSDFLEIGRDSQALALWNTPGPILIEDSYFEATGENILVGGADPKMAGLIPSDLTFRGCYCFKPLRWMQTARGSVKNLFELKLGRRVLVEHCVFEHNWPDAQDGRGIVLTVRNQDSGAPWSTIQDVTIRSCLLTDIAGAAVSMLGLEDRPGVASVQGTNLRLEQLLIRYCRNGFQFNNPFQPTVIRHCTTDRTENWCQQWTNAPMPPGLFTYQDNVTPTGQYGIVGDGTGIGLPTLEAHAPQCVFDHNVLEQSNAYRIPMPAGNAERAAGWIAAHLDDDGNYTGPERSSTGLPMGADGTAIRARIPWW